MNLTVTFEEQRTTQRRGFSSSAVQDMPSMALEVDDRDGSPCRQAATELMVPGSFGEDQKLLQEQHPTFSQTLATYFPGSPYLSQQQVSPSGSQLPPGNQHSVQYGREQFSRQPPWNFWNQQELSQQYSQQPSREFPGQWGKDVSPRQKNYRHPPLQSLQPLHLVQSAILQPASYRIIPIHLSSIPHKCSSHLTIHPQESLLQLLCPADVVKA